MRKLQKHIGNGGGRECDNRKREAPGSAEAGGLNAALVAVVLGFLAGGQAKAAPIAFTFDYIDPAGQGFNNPTSGPVARAALEEAGHIWGTHLPSSYAAETIDLVVKWVDTVPGYLESLLLLLRML